MDEVWIQVKDLVPGDIVNAYLLPDHVADWQHQFQPVDWEVVGNREVQNPPGAAPFLRTIPRFTHDVLFRISGGSAIFRKWMSPERWVLIEND
jgi:hypothetical protein